MPAGTWNVPDEVNFANPPLTSNEWKFDPSHTISRVSPEYIFGVATPSIVSPLLGSSVTTVVPSVVAFRNVTHQPAPSVAAAVNVWVIDAVISMSFPASAVPRIVLVERDS